MILLIGMVSAVTWSPDGNVDLKGEYNMTNLNFFETFTMIGNILFNDYNATGINFLNVTTIEAVDYGLVEDDIPTLSSTWDNTMDADRLTGLDYLDNQTLVDWANLTNKFITAVDNSYIHMVGTTATFNITLAGTNLSVNSSDNWDNLDTINATQMEDSGGTLNILESWLNSLFIELGDAFGGDVNGTYDNLQVEDNSHTHGWTNLSGYPVACSTYSAITGLNDSVTCTDSWVNIDGDTMTGDLNISGSLNLYKSSGSYGLEIETDSGTSQINLDGAKTSDGAIGSLNFFNNGDSLANIQSYRIGADDAGDLRFLTQKTGGGSTEKVRIDSEGHVGIGKTNPTATLDVNQSSATGNTAWFYRDLDNASTDSSVVFIEQDNTLDNQPALLVQSDGSAAGAQINVLGGRGLLIYQNGDGRGIDLQYSATTQYGIFIQADSLTSGRAFSFQSNSPDLSGMLGKMVVDHVNATGNVLEIQQDGIGRSLSVDHNGVSGEGIFVDMTLGATGDGVEVFNKGTGKGLYINQDGNGTGLYIDSEASATGKYPLEISGATDGISIYISDNVSAAGYIDRTPYFTGTSKQALDSILSIKGINGKIDHSTLPDFAKAIYQKPIRTYTNETYIEEEITSYQNISKFNNETNITEIEKIPIYENVTKIREIEHVTYEEKEGRSLGGMITLLTDSIKYLFEWNTEQDNRIELLENELCKKDNSYAFCEVGKL